MVYRAYQLLARLNHLQLAGCSEGELQWLGTTDQWQEADEEEIHFALGEDYVGVTY